MPTIHQLSKGMRGPRFRRRRAAALAGGPQRLGAIVRITTFNPRKPNSAKRTVARVRILLNKKGLFSKIPGIGEHYLQAHSSVMVRGHGPKDTPGVNYHLIRGKYDFHRVETYGRKNRRSKFGVKAVKHGM
jgi:small subunit ribosomal protein S12